MMDAKTAWEPYRPSAKNPWDLAKVGHLHRRATFGATWAELQAGVAAGPEKTIERLLAGGSTLPEFEKGMEPLAESISRANNPQQMTAWWLYRMIYSPHPLREKITLFWHNHFATSFAKVQNTGYMLGQYALLYRHALGQFGPMLHDISRDPAMMIWLDTIQSVKGQPNENYARELMELFSLGIGNYTEADIREAARAFTGWAIREGKYHFSKLAFDDSEKNVFGKRGAFTGDDIVDLCLQKDSCAKFIVRKLFRFLISESVPATPELVEPLATQYRESGYDTGKLIATMLRSNLFFSAEVYRSRIKSPVDFALGIVRGLEGRPGASAVADALETLGQKVFQPPSVKGWDGGTTWLNGQTLLFRQNLALSMTSTEDVRFGSRCDPAALARKHGKKSDADIVDFFVKLFLQGNIPDATRQQLIDYLAQAAKRKYPVYWSEQDIADHRIRAVCHLVLTLPEFQLD